MLQPADLAIRLHPDVGTASGKRTKSELLGFGEDEFAPWVVGATM